MTFGWTYDKLLRLLEKLQLIEVEMENILELLQQDVAQAKSVQEVDMLRSKYLGKKSLLKQQADQIRNIPPEKRQEFGQQLNAMRASVEKALEDAKKGVVEKIIQDRISGEHMDLSLPEIGQQPGSLHPLTMVEHKCTSLLRRLGFSVVDGPEVESAYYNFDALNVPEHHPARDAQDTFWVDGGLLMRSHTTTVQARILEANKNGTLPIKIVSPGRTYRNETVDTTHLACFHQYEGLWVGEGVKLSHLKGTLEYLLKSIYGEDRKVRFKPKFYPYTEPSIGADVSCKNCGGAGCQACHGAGWVTVVGAGMVHPKVFKGLGYDPEKVSGFAFGIGISRMVSQFYKANMRQLYGMNLQVFKNIRGRD